MKHDKQAAWRIATVTAIIKLRTWAIRNGASPLKAWDMTSERIRLATRRASTVEAWVSTVMRSFRIATVDADTCADFVELVAVVGDDTSEWLRFVEDEHQFNMALARITFDRDKKKRKKTIEANALSAKEVR